MEKEQKMSKGFKAFIIVSSIIVALIIGAIIFVSVYVSTNRVKMDMSLEQVERSQQIKVGWTTDKPVDKVKISVTHDGKDVKTVVLTNSNDLSKGSYNVEAFYGVQSVKVTVSRNGVGETKRANVNVYADEYNFAPLIATMPVTMLSLDINNITNNGTIPTFVWLERVDAWNFGNLPAGVQLMPTVSYSKVTTKQDIGYIYTETAKYVKELYDMHPESKFHMYYNDLWSTGLLQATYANGLEEDAWDAVLLSDGTATFSMFNSCYNNSNADTNYATMLEKYNTLINEIKTKKSFKLYESGFSVTPDMDFGKYAYVMAEQNDNISWWVAGINSGSSSAFAPSNTIWRDKAAAQSTRFNIGSYFDSTNTKYLTEAQQTQLKKLYNLDAVSTVFADAETAGKKVMVILGSSPTSESNANFALCVKALQAYYGDDYVYCYKGHPGYPSYQEKIDAMAELGLQDLDSSIAAEFFFFFYPNAYASGLPSSTYLSVDADNVMALFNSAKGTTFTGNYQEKVDVFMRKITDADATYGSLITDTDQILLEFADTTNYDVAIYDLSENAIKYYANNGTEFELVTE